MPRASQSPPRELVRYLNRVFSEFDRLAEKYRLEKIKTIGDAYMAVAGLPSPRTDHARAAAEMALDMLELTRNFHGLPGSLTVRIGMSSGPVVAGVIGHRKFAYDLWGETVNTASRMQSHGTPGVVHISQDTFRLLEGHYECGGHLAAPSSGERGLSLLDNAAVGIGILDSARLSQLRMTYDDRTCGRSTD